MTEYKCLSNMTFYCKIYKSFESSFDIVFFSEIQLRRFFHRQISFSFFSPPLDAMALNVVLFRRWYGEGKWRNRKSHPLFLSRESFSENVMNFMICAFLFPSNQLTFSSPSTSVLSGYSVGEIIWYWNYYLLLPITFNVLNWKWSPHINFK